MKDTPTPSPERQARDTRVAAALREHPDATGYIARLRVDDLRSILIDLAAAEARAVKAEASYRDAVKHVAQYAREAGLATGKLEMSEAAGIVEGWMERAETAETRADDLQRRLDAVEARIAGVTVERVARALCAFHGSDPDAPYIELDGSRWPTWEEYQPEARAILALLHPQQEADK